MGKEVGIYQLRDLLPLKNWVKGRAILIGDAAHPSKYLILLVELVVSPYIHSAPSSSGRRYERNRGRRSALVLPPRCNS